MSDTSDETIKSDRLNDKEENICRDFARGLCERKYCKFKHEQEHKILNFCHDYQNSVCPRPNCKFIHCTTEEVELYKRTGEMSNQIIAEATRKNQLFGSTPICNQYRSGQCRRTYCKYRHLTKEEEETEIRELIQSNTQRKHVPVAVPASNGNTEPLQPIQFFTIKGFQRTNLTDFEECSPPLPKRRLISQEADLISSPSHGFKGYFAGNPPPPIVSRMDARTIMLEEENSLLHKEIAQLKRQVSDLTATNEFLLDQNANLRVSGKRNGQVTMPAVSITNTGNNAAPQQQVIRTVTASVATVPVSIATVSTCNQMSGNPSISIAGVPTATVSIAQPAGQILAPHNQQIFVTTNPTTQLGIPNSSQAQLAIAQQNLATNLAQQAQAQPQLTSQAQQLALATSSQQLTSQAVMATQQQLALAARGPQITLTSTPQQLNAQLTSQAQQLANQQLTNQAQQLANQQLTNQAQQLANQQLTNQAQQLANQQLTNQAQQLANQQLTNQAQQLANQQLTSQAQQLANQQLTSQAQQLALASTQALANGATAQIAVASLPQQLTLSSAGQQLLAATQSQQIELHRSNQMASQTMAMSQNATQPLVSYPIMAQNINHALAH